MRHDPVDRLGRQADIGHHFAQHRGEIGDGVAEDFAALHPDVADRPRRRRPAVDIEHICVFSLRMEARREDALIVLDLLGRQGLVGFQQLDIVIVKVFVVLVGAVMHHDIFAFGIDKPSFKPVIDIDRVKRKYDLFLRSFAS